MEIKNKRLTDDEFYEIRKTVLNQWPTGKDVDLEDSFAFHKSLPDSKVFSKKLAEAKANRVTLVQPRAGVALVQKHIELLTYLQDKGGADLLPTTIDSYTRQNRYKEAEVGIAESIKTGKSMLNGFPAVNHGVAAVRQVVNAIDVPLQIRHGRSLADGNCLCRRLHQL